jgi:esterase/lipase superfamily enzyme
MANRPFHPPYDEHYRRIPSRHLGRPVHLWSFGHAGMPVVVFPSAAGMAHEWRHSQAVQVLAPWIAAGKLKLYCPESNVSVAWTGRGHPSWRLDRHRAYELFVAEELLALIEQETGQRRVVTTGASFGCFYAANFALKHPDRVAWALCLSGRYRTEAFLDGFYDDRVYYADPLHYVPNLSGDALRKVQDQTELTLVVGRGPFEGRCITETADLARVLLERGIPCEPDFWGHDVAHHWSWWKKQIRHHFGRRFPDPSPPPIYGVTER